MSLNVCDSVRYYVLTAKRARGGKRSSTTDCGVTQEVQCSKKTQGMFCVCIHCDLSPVGLFHTVVFSWYL